MDPESSKLYRPTGLSSSCNESAYRRLAARGYTPKTLVKATRKVAVTPIALNLCVPTFRSHPMIQGPMKISLPRSASESIIKIDLGVDREQTSGLMFKRLFKTQTVQIANCISPWPILFCSSPEYGADRQCGSACKTEHQVERTRTRRVNFQYLTNGVCFYVGMAKNQSTV
ncbi:hypothetical protein N7539_004983 [Penicillium diatomitis]|uniref:Uncharacterized protein n=1 Tax=Penicillium diatomitis TaxID=2819901 RepID=A0A9X0BUV0_9EURO|nr:uncharacterized protein N7539_004983 [Penicillium diatomitis]KAJ5484995.1 hypothetical protein N7539_004983 [Penicillium diatomitis]